MCWHADDPHILLTNAEAAAADRAAMASGVDRLKLMENAGRRVAEEAWLRFHPLHVLLIAGPGNNGGDAHVAARWLKHFGCRVRLALFGAPERLRGDAARMLARLGEAEIPVEPAVDVLPLAQDAGMPRIDLVVDGLFGAGLSRPIDGEAACVVEAMNAIPAPRLAIDIPSGVSGDDGQVAGIAVRADLTVTFARAKRGHLLMPGRLYCGEVRVADIGISDEAILRTGARSIENHPDWWRAFWPPLDPAGNKYRRGYAVVVGGRPPMLGAARMSARAALRTGAGLVTLATPREGWAVEAGALEAVMVQPFASPDELAEWLADPRRNAIAFGPGAGRDEWTRRIVADLLALARPLVLDADALSAFAEDPAQLFAQLHDGVVLTPHMGEFARLFPDLAEIPDKAERTVRAAQRAGATILLKGADTVVADPSGGIVIDKADVPHLATAGAGDVLAGIILGLLAQGMPPLPAAAAGQWLLKSAASRFCRGMVATDLIKALPAVLVEPGEATSGA